MISIYDFFSYHEFLEQWFENKQKTESHFSQREFLRRAKINGSAVLHRIFSGAAIPQKYIEAFTDALDLSKAEQEYWVLLIEYEDAKTIQERGNAFSSLLKIRSKFPKYKLDDRSLKFFKRWYYPVVREIINLVDGLEDYNKISRMVIPPITSIQAKNAVIFLEKNAFLSRDSNGKLIQSEPTFSTGERRPSALLAAYHKKNLEINFSALDIIPKDLISLSSMTLNINPATYQQIRNELVDFRARLLELAQKDENPEQVFHINFTLLPRSKNIHEKEDSK